MTMKRLFSIMLLAALVLNHGISFSRDDDRDSVCQVSTINALMGGSYDGDMTLAELREFGDTAIGTFDALDGEMVCVDGQFFRIGADGNVHSASSDIKTPFAVIAFFAPYSRIELLEVDNIDELKGFLDANVPSKNIFYAVKVTGTFDYLKMRSVPDQTKPYPPLSEVVKTQPVFERRGIRGTLVGFRAPAYTKGICVTGYHFHFISDDRTCGGHVLDCAIDKGTARLDDKYGFSLKLPRTKEFAAADLTGDTEYEINKAER